jgi:hypothetical protein
MMLGILARAAAGVARIAAAIATGGLAPAASRTLLRFFGDPHDYVPQAGARLTEGTEIAASEKADTPPALWLSGDEGDCDSPASHRDSRDHLFPGQSGGGVGKIGEFGSDVS